MLERMRQEEKGTTENEMVGWHYRFNGHEFEQTLGDKEDWCTTFHGVTMSWTQVSD